MILRIKITDRVIVKKNSQRIMRNHKGGTFIAPSAAFERFKNRARAKIMDQTHGMVFRKPVRMDYTFFLKGKMDSDLDNIIASVNDVLMNCKVLKDDSLITSLTAQKISGCRSFETEIIIEGEA